jgi:hypothetical protein
LLYFARASLGALVERMSIVRGDRSLELTDRQKELVKYIQNLCRDKRHIIKVICRGNEPWEIEEHITQKKIELKPQKSD